MNFSDIKYFFEVVNCFDKVLPPDLREIEIDIEINQLIDINKIIETINNIFFNKDIIIKTKHEILVDIKNIIEAIVKNENTTSIQLISKSRFSLVFKIGTKVLKIGFPKIVYKYPKSNIILDSIIRKQYLDGDKPVLFVEVQDFKENNLYKYYSRTEIDEIIYCLWKKLRKNGIVWYDPKDKNIVIDNKNNSKKWNDIYYKKSNEKEKGQYYIDNDILDINEGLLIVDTDLFIPLETIKKLKEIKNNKPDLPFFQNWKYNSFLKYEDRYLMEEEYERK